jgi:putative transposase
VVEVVESTSDREARHSRSMAPERLPSPLALSISKQTGGQTGHRARGSGLPPHHGEREPDLGAPRIHGELLKLGFEISERTVSRYLARLHPRDGAAHCWRTFLKNHREVIAGMDFFTVITANFRILYCLFLIHHNRREIIHFNVTEHPTGEWVVQQLRQAFPESTDDQYLIFDRDTKFSAEVRQFLDSAGVSAVRTSYRSPWQNGVAERWVRSFRNDLLDHVIVLHAAHLRRLARDYLGCYHADRTHDGLDKDTPQGRPPFDPESR